jgi:hypothetical protein
MEDTLELFKKYGIKPTRENILEFEFAGTDVDIDNLPMEYEIQLPVAFRRKNGAAELPESGLLSIH